MRGAFAVFVAASVNIVSRTFDWGGIALRLVVHFLYAYSVAHNLG